jgi:hypothetical protein
MLRGLSELPAVRDASKPGERAREGGLSASLEQLKLESQLSWQHQA